ADHPALDLRDPDWALFWRSELWCIDALAAFGDRLECVRHIERRDALLETTDDHRVVVRYRRPDPHRLGHLRDPPGADAHPDLGEDAVVGYGGRVGERDRS